MLTTDSVSGPEINYNKSKETATVTFRIDKVVLDKIRAEASRHDTSLNSFLNQILREFTEWDMFMPDAGSIPVAKPVVVQMFQKLRLQGLLALRWQKLAQIPARFRFFMRNCSKVETRFDLFVYLLPNVIHRTMCQRRPIVNITMLPSAIDHFLLWSSYASNTLPLGIEGEFGCVYIILA